MIASLRNNPHIDGSAAMRRPVLATLTVMLGHRADGYGYYDKP
jgi:hypothetical protein